jgi:hypothetical protein
MRQILKARTKAPFEARSPVGVSPGQWRFEALQTEETDCADEYEMNQNS